MRKNRVLNPWLAFFFSFDTNRLKKGILVFTLLLAAAIFGCNESQQTTGLSKENSVDDLKFKAVEIIAESLDDEDPRVRAKAVEVASATGRRQLMPVVERLLKDDFVPVRFAAVLALGDMQYQLAKDKIKILLKDPDENVRLAAAYAMGKLGSYDSLPVLEKALNSKNQVIRANAALLLGKNGDTMALMPLYRALKDESSQDKVRFQVADAIARLGDEQIINTLWTMLISSYADDRVTGIRAVGALGSEKAKDILVTMLDDDILEVRLVTAEQLAMLGLLDGEARVLDVFTKKLTSNMDAQSTERVNVLTALAIGRLGSSSLTKFLPQLLNNESRYVRIAAAQAILTCR